MMFAKYFEYYTIILREGQFFRGHAADVDTEATADTRSANTIR